MCVGPNSVQPILSENTPRLDGTSLIRKQIPQNYQMITRHANSYLRFQWREEVCLQFVRPLLAFNCRSIADAHEHCIGASFSLAQLISHQSRIMWIFSALSAAYVAVAHAAARLTCSAVFVQSNIVWRPFRSNFDTTSVVRWWAVGFIVQRG